MGAAIDLNHVERRVSTAEFALRMNICEKELYERINNGLIEKPFKDGRKNYWMNSYVMECIQPPNTVKPDNFSSVKIAAE